MTPPALERLYREEYSRILASLARVVGDLELAEESVQDAFVAALERWPRGGLPPSPGGWLARTARNRAIDRLRRRTRFKARTHTIEALRLAIPDAPPAPDARPLPDDRLALFFACCHPALAEEARVALTLRTLGGLTTDEVARAFLVPVPTMAQRLVRAKRKIRAAGIPFAVPGPEVVAERLQTVLSAVYLIFSEGYAATRGADLVRVGLCDDALYLGRLLHELSAAPASAGLLALMLLHDSRRDTRSTPGGSLVRLEDQDRSRWDRAKISRGLALVEEALRGGPAEPFGVQAAIAALHARAARPEDTDWAQVEALYGVLFALTESPIVALNRAVAVAMAQGPEAGLAQLDALEEGGALASYHLLPAARADLLRRLGRPQEAAAAYAQARALAENAAEQRFLDERLAELAP